jgi:hypothetical protein
VLSEKGDSLKFTNEELGNLKSEFKNRNPKSLDEESFWNLDVQDLKVNREYFFPGYQ